MAEFTNSGGSGDLTGFQSGIRQRFVRQGAGLNLAEGTTTTQPQYSPVVTTTHEAFSTVDRQQWSDFLAAREGYSETFGTTTGFSSSTPGATYPDSVGAYPLTWYPLSYSVNVETPTVGVAGSCTVTVNVISDQQEYRRLKKITYGPPDNPVVRDRTDEDGYPINSAVYPHAVRFFYQVWASNAGKSASFGGTQAQTGIIEIPAIKEYPVPSYPTSFVFDLPTNWWGIEITNLGRSAGEAFAYDPENGLPMTQSSNGGEVNWYGTTSSFFMGVAPKFTYTETTGGEYLGDKQVTVGGTYDPYGDTGDIAAFQSTYKQQLVREGGALDLASGTALTPGDDL